MPNWACLPHDFALWSREANAGREVGRGGGAEGPVWRAWRGRIGGHGDRGDGRGWSPAALFRWPRRPAGRADPPRRQATFPRVVVPGLRGHDVRVTTPQRSISHARRRRTSTVGDPVEAARSLRATIWGDTSRWTGARDRGGMSESQVHGAALMIRALVRAAPPREGRTRAGSEWRPRERRALGTPRPARRRGPGRRAGSGVPRRSARGRQLPDGRLDHGRQRLDQQRVVVQRPIRRNSRPADSACSRAPMSTS